MNRRRSCTRSGPEPTASGPESASLPDRARPGPSALGAPIRRLAGLGRQPEMAAPVYSAQGNPLPSTTVLSATIISPWTLPEPVVRSKSRWSRRPAPRSGRASPDPGTTRDGYRQYVAAARPAAVAAPATCDARRAVRLGYQTRTLQGQLRPR